MDALEFRIHEALRAIAREAFPERSLPPFGVSLSDKHYKNLLGRCHYHFNGGNALIEIFRLYREPRLCILTAIHELAHHVDYSHRGRSGHDREFYICHAHLLAAACRMQIFTPDMLEKLYAFESDGRGDKKLAKLMRRMIESGEISSEPIIDKEYMKDYRLLSVYKAFDIKDLLKKKGFKFNSRSRGWEMIGTPDVLMTWQKILDDANITYCITGVLDASIIATACVNGKGTYEIKNILKKRGYYYNNRCWYRHFNIKQYKKEVEFLGIIMEWSYKQDPIVRINCQITY